MLDSHNSHFEPQHLKAAIESETKKFSDCYSWLESSMPLIFFDEVAKENITLIAHALVGFDLQEYVTTINIKRSAIVMCLDNPDADLCILKNFSTYGIRNYQCYISSKPLPFPNCKTNLRIAVIHFTEIIPEKEKISTLNSKEQLRVMVKARSPEITHDEFEELFSNINATFLRVLPINYSVLAIDMYYRAKTRDNCQYEVCYNEDWETQQTSSIQIVLAWKNTPKYNFLYRLATVISRHDLMMKKVSATYIDPYSRNSILIMVLDIHSSSGKAAWDVANIPDFLRDLATVKYFAEADLIDTLLVSKRIISGNHGNLLRSMTIFIHQSLVHIDPNLYTVDKIKEDLCRHPEFTIKLLEAFDYKFHPEIHNKTQFEALAKQFENDVDQLDTGIEVNDLRRKNILLLGLAFIRYTLKTNFFRLNYTAMSFRLDPEYLNKIPFDRSKKFPEIPYAIFFIKGMHFFGFHIRFKDLSRGGLRTVYLEHTEHLQQESNNVFSECYNLAYTQHLKNKDIPEGGSKGIIFLTPWDRLDSETLILQSELEGAGMSAEAIQDPVAKFRTDQKEEYLYHAQRSFIESLISIVNCEPNGKIRAKYIVDYLNRPEYIYLGPDENMHDATITWIANFSKRYHYKPGSAFISGKPRTGINHKEYGVTSLGINVYMKKTLEFLGIDPKKQNFTLKMSGGPDGDVAGNMIANLVRDFPDTAKLLMITDISGCIYDPKGLQLPILFELFKQAKPIKYYPPENLSDGGFLLDKTAKRSNMPLVQQTLCWKKMGGKLIEDWLSGSEMNQLWRSGVHKVKADIFIPAGGRPRTLSETSVKEYLDENGLPTSKAIIEGANLYLTPRARLTLEKLGVLIIKDSSANKTGVICSSFEVLCGLAIGDERFVIHRNAIIKEILDRLEQCALNEANLLLQTHKANAEYLTSISDTISAKINFYTYQLLDYFEPISLSQDFNDPLLKCFLEYCLPTLQNHFKKELLEEIPDNHKKAIIACHLASQIVYQRGLMWHPSIIDILPVLLQANALIELPDLNQDS